MKGSTTRRRSIKTAKPGGFAATIIYGDKSLLSNGTETENFTKTTENNFVTNSNHTVILLRN